MMTNLDLKRALGIGILLTWCGYFCSAASIGGVAVEAALLGLHGRAQIFISITVSVRTRLQMPALWTWAFVFRVLNCGR